MRYYKQNTKNRGDHRHHAIDAFCIALTDGRMLAHIAEFDKRQTALFRKHLLEFGFTRMQFSVYTRFVIGTEQVEKQTRRVSKVLPPGGEVRVIAFTDKQWERMHVFFGKSRQQQKNPWQQVMFFCGICPGAC